MKLHKWLQRLYCLYFDIPTFVIILLLISCVYRPLIYMLISGVQHLDQLYELPPIFFDISYEALIEILAAIIVIPVVMFFVCKILNKASSCGKFTAYDIKKDGTQELWGTVRLSYNLFSNERKGEFQKKDDNSRCVVKAVFERGCLP